MSTKPDQSSQRTVCPRCGYLVYATFQTTWTAMQQAHRELQRHMTVYHSSAKGPM